MNTTLSDSTINKSISWEMGLFHWIWAAGFGWIGIKSLDPLF